MGVLFALIFIFVGLYSCMTGADFYRIMTCFGVAALFYIGETIWGLNKSNEVTTNKEEKIEE